MASKQRPTPMKGNVFQRFMSAKFLAIPAIIMLIGTLVNITALVVPYWFDVRSVSYSRNGDMSLSEDSMGLFLYLKNGYHTVYDKPGIKELNRVQKATSTHLVPDPMKIAQIMWLLGTTVGAAATAGLVLVAISPYLHLVAEIGLAAALSGGAISLLISVILSFASLGSSCTPDYNWCRDMWRDTEVSLEAVNWGFFVAILGTVMMIASAVMLWMQFCRTLRAVEYIRSMPYYPLDDEPTYLQYDYRKTVRPPLESYAPPPPMVTLPQMHDDRHGYPGVMSPAPPAYHDPGYDTRPSPKGQRAPPSYSEEPPSGYYGEPSPRSLKSPRSYSGSQEVSF